MLAIRASTCFLSHEADSGTNVSPNSLDHKPVNNILRVDFLWLIGISALPCPEIFSNSATRPPAAYITSLHMDIEHGASTPPLVKIP